MEVIYDQNVMVRMSDGVGLCSDIFRPATDEPVPVLLHRTPYGKRASYSQILLFEPMDAIERGYAVVIQDVRGVHSSEGIFRPLHNEREDGHEAINWVADQPWCNGKVGIYGSSYMGFTTLQASVDAPPALQASLAYITGANYHNTWCYNGGAFEFGSRVKWALSQLAANINRNPPTDEDELRLLKAEVAFMATNPDAYYKQSFDLRSISAPWKHRITFIDEYLDHPDYDDYWKTLDIVAAADRITAPMLYIEGWYDTFLNAGIDIFRALRANTKNPHHKDHRFVIGPWDHEAYLGERQASKAGVRDYGPTAFSGRLGLKTLALDWFDRWLKDGEQELATVRYFHIGPNRWEESTSWPPPETTEDRWYLHSGGHALTQAGDGVLTRTPPADEPPDAYIYDPNDPAPTLGGRHVMAHVRQGVQDQRPIEDRSDVVVYTSAALLHPLTIQGNIKLELSIRSSAPATDFCAVLAHVHKDGFVENIADGITRIRFDESSKNGLDKVCEIDLWDVSYTIPAGEQLRVHITSSSFPRYDRNRNVGPDAPPDASAVAIQHVLHDRDNTSVLIMQVPK